MEADEAADLAVGDAALEHQPAHMPGRGAQPLGRLLQGQQPDHGAELLDWAGGRAADEGAEWLRVDVWTTNERLQHYYLKQGFTYVRTVVLPHNPSGALFQRPAERVPTPHLQEVESLTG
jgi:ribosomal protein S18 acetylase RimI-like enzyme